MITGKKSVLVITHDGWKFHTDEIFACAILILHYELAGIHVHIVRTRDNRRFPFADHLVDVGEKNDERNFDHHKGIGGKRGDGIPYASTGLAWKSVGSTLCSNDTVFSKVDEEFIRYIDAWDNGSQYETRKRAAIFSFMELVSARRKPEHTPEESDYAFTKLISLAKKILRGKIGYFEKRFGSGKPISTNNPREDEEIFSVTRRFEGTFTGGSRRMRKRLRQLKQLGEKIANAPMIDLSKPDFKKLIESISTPETPQDVMMKKPEVLFVIYPANSKESRWIIRSTKNPFPGSWKRARGITLQKIVGTNDILSCQKGGLIATAKTFEAARHIAKKAILVTNEKRFTDKYPKKATAA